MLEKRRVSTDDITSHTEEKDRNLDFYETISKRLVSNPARYFPFIMASNWLGSFILIGMREKTFPKNAMLNE